MASAEPTVSTPLPARPAVSSGEPDLWCCYAAIRTLAWLGRLAEMPDRDRTVAFLLRHRNGDGGYAWSKGMPSDAWATFYCTQALTLLGAEVPALDRAVQWLHATWSGDAFAMTPGQEPDVWATYFSARTLTGVCGRAIPAAARLSAWLGSLQTSEGGLGWTPGHAAAGEADVRACHYAIGAWETLSSVSPVSPPWDITSLVGWLRARQSSSGGFTFAADAEVPCMWATYRACASLAALGAEADPAVIDWMLRLRGPHGAFVRWEGYEVEDVWASFSAVGTLRALGSPLDNVTGAVARRMRELALPGGGFTYREPPLAADALSTAASVLADTCPDPAAARRWLETCQLPNEGGLMYMPARGAEIRCTLWGLSAGAFAGDPAARREIARWLRRMQNPDGGFGYWHGRGSDLVSTAAAVEAIRLLGARVGDILDTTRLRTFLERCRRPDGLGFGLLIGADPALRSTLQGIRIEHSLGHLDRAALADALQRHRVRGGGWADSGRRVPDLLSTYEAVATSDLCDLGTDTGPVRVFLNSITTPTGTSWTPLGPSAGDRLSECLGRLLRSRITGGHSGLPALTL